VIATPPEAPRRRRNPLALAAIVVIVVAFTAMWVYAFFFASRENPDKLPDEAWRERTEATCGEYRAVVDELPPARSFADVEPREEAMRQRADVGAEANLVLREMVAAIAADEPDDAKSRDGAARWLADWDRYLAVREQHVEDWRAGIDEPFEEPPIEEGQITPVSLRMDAFAKINRMPSCQVPKDFG
jgi:hypothetical protein